MPLALVTGAATGIGMALARKLDAEGWTVFAGIHRTPPADLLKGASPRLRALPLDVADAEQVRRAAETVEAAAGKGGLDLLVSNAAMTGAPGPIETIDLAAFRQLMEVNFWGPIQLVQACLPLLRRARRPRVVLVSSGSVYLTIPLGCAYPVSKSALAALARHLRLELAPFGIEVTDLQPGGVRTPMTAFPAQEEAVAWEAIPAPLREAYRAHFAHPGSALSQGFSFEAPEAFAERIYGRIVCARRLRPVYVLGPGVAPLPWLHRLLPRSAVEAVWRRLFRARGSGAAA
jgi:NAD(P)-dependent dehydrogenase (short-subunit alcohol dehydrogenase family)